jgi:HEAT repeat protein
MIPLARVAALCALAASLSSLSSPALAQQTSFEDVVRNLRNPDARARLSAVRLLREAGYAEAAVPIAAVVTDRIDDIQLEAIAAELSFAAVEEVPSRRHVALIVEVRNKGQALRLLEQGPLAAWPRSAPPEVVSALLTAVDDESPRVRTEAIYALGVLAQRPLTDDSAARLIKALDHYDASIRAAAARVIGRLRVAAAGDALIAAVNDSSPAVRYASMLALGALREPRAVHALTEQFTYYGKGEGAWSALAALAHIAAPSSVPLFTSRLADKDPFLRRAALEGLARSGDTSHAEAIRTAGNDSSAMVRAAAAFAGLRTGQDSVSRLLEFLVSDATALQVQEYMLEIGPSIVPGLLPGLKDPDSDARARAAEIVGALGGTEEIGALEPLTRDRARDVAETADAAIARIRMRK